MCLKSGLKRDDLVFKAQGAASRCIPDALEQALYDRQPQQTGGLVHHSDRGSQYVSWFNHHRLLAPIGYIPPAEAEENYYRQLTEKVAVEV